MPERAGVPVDPVRAAFERALALSDGSSLLYLLRHGAADTARDAGLYAGTLEQAMMEVVLRSVPLEAREWFLVNAPAEPYLRAALRQVNGAES